MTKIKMLNYRKIVQGWYSWNKGMYLIISGFTMQKQVDRTLYKKSTFFKINILYQQRNSFSKKSRNLYVSFSCRWGQHIVTLTTFLSLKFISLVGKTYSWRLIKKILCITWKRLEQSDARTETNWRKIFIVKIHHHL